MFSPIQQNNSIPVYVNGYAADEESDIQDLPTNISPGSYCIIISTSDVYMLNNKKEWVKL